MTAILSMRIAVRTFAAYRQAIGQGAFTLDLPAGTTPGQVWGPPAGGEPARGPVSRPAPFPSTRPVRRQRRIRWTGTRAGGAGRSRVDPTGQRRRGRGEGRRGGSRVRPRREP